MDLRAVVGLARPFTMLAPVLGVACGATNAAYALGIPYDVGRVGLAALSAMYRPVWSIVPPWADHSTSGQR